MLKKCEAAQPAQTSCSACSNQLLMAFSVPAICVWDLDDDEFQVTISDVNLETGEVDTTQLENTLIERSYDTQLENTLAELPDELEPTQGLEGPATTAELTKPKRAGCPRSKCNRKLNLGGKLKVQSLLLSKLNKLSAVVKHQKGKLQTLKVALKMEQDAVKKYTQEMLEMRKGPESDAANAASVDPGTPAKDEIPLSWRQRGPAAPITHTPADPELAGCATPVKKVKKTRVVKKKSEQTIAKHAFFSEKLQQGYSMKGVWAAWRAKQAGEDEEKALEAQEAKPKAKAAGDGAAAEAVESMRDGHQYFLKHGRKLEDIPASKARAAWKAFSREAKHAWNAKAAEFNAAKLATLADAPAPGPAEDGLVAEGAEQA